MSHIPWQYPPQAELYFPAGESSPAFLTLSTDGSQATVELAPRIARVICILQDARAQDALLGVDQLARGWRTRTRIAAEIEQRTDYPIEVATVTAYVSKLLRALAKKKSVFSAKDLQLIERRRGLGFRLAPGLKLTVLVGETCHE